MSRRKPNPHELATVLQRLERLGAGRVGPAPPAPQAGPAAGPATEPATEPAADPGVASPLGLWAPRERSPRAALAARLPEAVRHGVLDPGRRGLAALAALALTAALGGAWYFASAPSGRESRPATARSPSTAASSAATPPASAASGWPGTSSPTPISSPTPAPIVVDVVGKVAAPGVVELPAGARIRDAVDAAGGALPGTDLTALDLASRLSDGQEIFVGIPPPSGEAARAAGGVVGGEPPTTDGGPAGGSGDGSAASAVVDLNTATLAQLETLPGVGPALAQRILDWRAQHGRFATTAQLQDVSGIGPAKYAALAGRVRA